MAIRGVSDQVRAPRLGKIRLGVKDEQRGFPVSKPYFVVPEEVAAIYGPEPTTLNVVFLDDDEDRVASAFYRAYNNTHGLICKGDGNKADALIDVEALQARGGDMTQPLPLDVWAHGGGGGRTATRQVARRQIDCPGWGYDGEPGCPLYTKERPDCKMTLILQFAIVGVPGLGVYQLDTSSVIAINEITGLIKMVKSMTGGHIAGVPMLLKRVSREVQRPPDMKKTTVWTVKLETDSQLGPAGLLEAGRRPVVTALLPPPDESGEYIDDERAVPGEVINLGSTQQPDAGRPQPAPEGAATPAAPAPPGRVYSPAIGDWLEVIADRKGKGAREAAQKGLRESYPYTHSREGQPIRALKPEDEAAAVEWLKTIAGEKPAKAERQPAAATKQPAQQQQPAAQPGPFGSAPLCKHNRARLRDPEAEEWTWYCPDCQQTFLTRPLGIVCEHPEDRRQYKPGCLDLVCSDCGAVVEPAEASPPEPEGALPFDN